MTKRVYEKMQNLQIQASNQIYLKYFEHQTKDFKEKRDKDKKERDTTMSSGTSSVRSSTRNNDDKEEDKSAVMQDMFMADSNPEYRNNKFYLI